MVLKENVSFFGPKFGFLSEESCEVEGSGIAAAKFTAPFNLPQTVSRDLKSVY